MLKTSKPRAISQLRLLQTSRLASSLVSCWRLRWKTVCAPISMPLALSVLRSPTDMTPGWPTCELMMKKVAFMPRLFNCCAAAICEGRPSSNVKETVVLGAAIAGGKKTQEGPRAGRGSRHTRVRTTGSIAAGLAASHSLSTLLVTLRITRPPAANPLLLRLDWTAPRYAGSRESRHRCTGGFRPPPDRGRAARRGMPFDGGDRDVVPTYAEPASDGGGTWNGCESA